MNGKTMRHLVSSSPEDTGRLAGELLREWGTGAVIALHGELGSGKTTFVQGLARALGIERPVTSPTFTLINEYRGTRRLVHVDLYRISGSAEALAIGLDNYLGGDFVTAIEWAERIADILPPDTLHVRLEVGERPNERRITIFVDR